MSTLTQTRHRHASLPEPVRIIDVLDDGVDIGYDTQSELARHSVEEDSVELHGGM